MEKHFNFHLISSKQRFLFSNTNNVNSTLGLALHIASDNQHDFHRLCYIVCTPHVPVFFLPSRHNFRDIELKFCSLS